MKKNERIQMIREYHDRTKHHPDRYANSPGYMDWPNQPDPFRSFDGAQTIPLIHPNLNPSIRFDDIHTNRPESPQMNAESIGRFFYHSLALSAWKQLEGGDPWSLRINPSSGALHPTEGYLIGGPIDGLTRSPGVFHYQPFHHQLEIRATLSPKELAAAMKGAAEDAVLIGLTSIYWREAWKYGERAFRYCNHDVGHAIGALAYSARLLGWSLKRLDHVDDEFLNRLLCTDAQTGIEREHGDCLFVLSPSSKRITVQPCRCVEIPTLSPKGTPNRVSRNHHEWSAIDKVSQASRGALPIRQDMTAQTHTPPQLIPTRNLSAEKIIRKRRSARDMDGETYMDRDVFYHIMLRLLPGQFPFNGFNFGPHVSIVLFVNRVNGLIPGLYILCRGSDHKKRLQSVLTDRFVWEKAEGTPGDLPLYRLLNNDVSEQARLICCHQDIASDGAFAAAMLADFDAVLELYGAPAYSGLFWETGLIGQVLYLQAEAAGLSGTGIGCFFDDLMHKMVGIKDHSWQSLYHFTVGKSLDDDQLKIIPPYYHLGTVEKEWIHNARTFSTIGRYNRSAGTSSLTIAATEHTSFYTQRPCPPTHWERKEYRRPQWLQKLMA